MPDEDPMMETAHDESPLPAIAFDLLCPSCSYNLRGLTGNRCPECGLELNEVRGGASSIPWVHRKEIGWYRAYWKTVWFVTTKRRRLSAEIARPVSYRDAQRFRWLTIAHAYIPILIITIVVYVLFPGTRPSFADTTSVGALVITYLPHWAELAFGDVWPVALLHVGILLWLAAATGVTSYFFHPRDLPLHIQNCAVALSYYANAALAWTSIPLTLSVLGLFLYSVGNRWWMVSVLGPLAIFAIAVFGWYVDALYALSRLIPARRERFRALALFLPLLWLILAVVIIPGVPAVVIGVLVVIESLS